MKHLAIVGLLMITGVTTLAQSVTLPASFDWGKIPSDYTGKTLEIKHHFNTGKTDIILPEKVTLKFNGGSLTGFR
jgi:hypothetical protein